MPSAKPLYQGNGGRGLVHSKFGKVKPGAEKIWHQFFNTTEHFGTKFPDCGAKA